MIGFSDVEVEEGGMYGLGRLHVYTKLISFLQCRRFHTWESCTSVGTATLLELLGSAVSIFGSHHKTRLGNRKRRPWSTNVSIQSFFQSDGNGAHFDLSVHVCLRVLRTWS